MIPVSRLRNCRRATNDLRCREVGSEYSQPEEVSGAAAVSAAMLPVSRVLAAEVDLARNEGRTKEELSMTLLRPVAAEVEF